MRGLRYANVVSTIALFVALGGGAYAAGLIGPDDIARDAVRSKHVNDDSLTGADVKESSLKLAGDWVQVASPPDASEANNIVADACPGQSAIFCGSQNYFGGVDTRWRNYGGGFATAGFYKDTTGVVHLRGLVVGPDTLAQPLIFFLPPAYAPDSRRVFEVLTAGLGNESDQHSYRLDVSPDGGVQIMGMTNDNRYDFWGYVSLEGISFRPDD